VHSTCSTFQFHQHKHCQRIRRPKDRASKNAMCRRHSEAATLHEHESYAAKTDKSSSSGLGRNFLKQRQAHSNSRRDRKAHANDDLDFVKLYSKLSPILNNCSATWHNRAYDA
jgi:hypothetical protein